MDERIARIKTQNKGESILLKESELGERIKTERKEAYRPSLVFLMLRECFCAQRM